MGTLTKVATMDQLEPGTALCVEVEGKQIAIFNVVTISIGPAGIGFIVFMPINFRAKSNQPGAQQINFVC